jgi:hypothetical protein
MKTINMMIMTGLLSIAPTLATAQTNTAFEDSVQGKCGRIGIDVWPFNGTTLKDSLGVSHFWTQQIWLQPYAVGNDTMHANLGIFKDKKYKFFFAGDSSDTAETVKIGKYNGGYYQQFDRSVPLDSGVNKILNTIINGPSSSSVVARPKYNRQPAALNSKSNIEGYFNLLGKKVQNEIPKEKYGIEGLNNPSKKRFGYSNLSIQMPNGIYINNKRKYSVAK